MKHIALLTAFLASPFSVNAQSVTLDNLFSGFQIYFETSPQINQSSEIAVLFPSCRLPFSQTFSEFPTETQVVGQEITLTYAFRVPNSPNCIAGLIVRYPLPILTRGEYRLRVNARLVTDPSSVPPRIVETRTMAQINFQVGEPLATQVPNLTPVGLAALSLLMLGVGAFVSGRRTV